jgi:hypothetical protein
MSVLEESCDFMWVLNVPHKSLLDEVIHRLELVVKDVARRIGPIEDHTPNEEGDLVLDHHCWNLLEVDGLVGNRLCISEAYVGRVVRIDHHASDRAFFVHALEVNGVHGNEEVINED